MRSAIGRVLRGAVPIGGACRVAPELAITCGHVVDFSRPAGAQGPAEVTVDFPWSQTPAPSPATVVASTSEGLQGGDVALLRLDGPPVGAPLLPALGAHAAGDPVSACGFPADTPQGAIGQWAYGHVQDARLDGWVQLNDADTTGYWVKPGFSGTPVWAHDGRVVVA